jgi:hypothetical protein
MLTKDEARRRIAAITRLAEPAREGRGGTARCLGAMVAADNGIVRASLRAAGPSRAISTEDCNARA